MWSDNSWNITKTFKFVLQDNVGYPEFVLHVNITIILLIPML